MESSESESRRICEEFKSQVAEPTMELVDANHRLHADIQRRSPLEKAFKQNEHRFRELVEAAGDVIWSADLNHRYTYVSPAISELLGYTVDEVMALNCLDILTPASRARVMSLLTEDLAVEQEIPASRTPFRTERIEQYRKDGSTVWVEATITVQRDQHGGPTGVMGVFRDVSVRKHIDDLKSDFVTAVAHELRTPLTSIRGYSELLLVSDDLTPEERRECLMHINRQSVVLADIISGMVEIARMESGRDLHMHPTLCDVTEQIHVLVTAYQAQSKTHVFEMALPTVPVLLFTDQERIRDVFDNLLSNAVKYSPNGGIIRVTCRLIDGACLFTVEDQGIGMTSQQVRRIFDKFYRVDHSNTAMSGMGVGMTIVKYVIEAQGGKVWVESRVGNGTTVSFTLPMAGSAQLEGGDTVEEDTHRG